MSIPEIATIVLIADPIIREHNSDLEAWEVADWIASAYNELPSEEDIKVITMDMVKFFGRKSE